MMQACKCSGRMLQRHLSVLQQETSNINTGKVVYNEILQDSFTPDGSLTSGPFALFSNMPPSRTLTMNLGVPEPWLVEPVVAV